MMVNKVSRLGFGLSSIAGSGNAAYQQGLIKTAIECGITHFDAAPFYGSGDAEAILGRALKGCNENVTITTKYGLVAFGSGTGAGSLRTLLRPVFRKASFLKRMALKMVTQVHRPKEVEFEKGALLRSIDQSIQKLSRPVDIFLLHDLDETFIENENLMAELSEAKRAGKIMFTGVSGTADLLKKVVNLSSAVYSVWQLENSLSKPAPVANLSINGACIITHRAIQGGLQQLTHLLKHRPGFREVLQRELDIDLSGSEKVAALLIELALTENPEGTVLFSTTQPDRVKKISAAAASPVLGEERCLRIREIFNQVYSPQKNLGLEAAVE